MQDTKESDPRPTLASDDDKLSMMNKYHAFIFDLDGTAVRFLSMFDVCMHLNHLRFIQQNVMIMHIFST